MVDEGETGENEMDEPEIEDEPKRFDAAYVFGLRSQAKGYRLKLREEERKLELLKNELETLQSGPSPELLEARESLARTERQLADLEDEQKKTAILKEAERLGFRNPTDAYKLLDLDDDPSAGLRKLAADNPFLVERPTAPTPGVGGPPITPPPPTATELFAQMLRNGVRGARGGRG